MAAIPAVLEPMADDGETSQRVENPIIAGQRRLNRCHHDRNLNIYPAMLLPEPGWHQRPRKIGLLFEQRGHQGAGLLQRCAQMAKLSCARRQDSQDGCTGHHEHDYDAGIDLGAGPGGRQYTVVVEAEDADWQPRRVSAAR